MTDGRTEAAVRALTSCAWTANITQLRRILAETALAAAAAWDREHGIVRVDTQDAATLHKVAVALLEMPEVDPLGRVKDLTAAAQDVLSALSVGALQGEASGD